MSRKWLDTGPSSRRKPPDGIGAANASLDSGPDAIGDDRGEGMARNFADVKLFTRKYINQGQGLANQLP